VTPATRPEPAGYPNALVTSVTYGERGLVQDSADPRGVKTRLFHDDLGRVIATVENFDDASIDWSSGDPPR
jgi:hypothetical protein